MQAFHLDDHGWCLEARHVPSPNCDDRPEGTAVVLGVIHNISLPPGEFGGPYIEALFTNTLDPATHPYFESIHTLRVSAHFLIRRDGQLLQFVPVNRRAWHAGVSVWQGRERCNDFSLGIELEGTDFQPFTAEQYQTLSRLALALHQRYPLAAWQGHSDIAPGRKTDPGAYFDWDQFRAGLTAALADK